MGNISDMELTLFNVLSNVNQQQKHWQRACGECFGHNKQLGAALGGH